jgi:hypothetical protein
MFLLKWKPFHIDFNKNMALRYIVLINYYVHYINNKMKCSVRGRRRCQFLTGLGKILVQNTNYKLQTTNYL